MEICESPFPCVLIFSRFCSLTTLSSLLSRALFVAREDDRVVSFFTKRDLLVIEKKGTYATRYTTMLDLVIVIELAFASKRGGICITNVT